jgi:endonuclease/exonuclease/phosphatase family metal-dependent hydrolase
MLYDINGKTTIIAPYNFVVMSFNVQKWQGLNSDINLMKSIINTYQADIIYLQEYRETISDYDVYSSLFAEYPYHYYGSSILNPVGIVSKHQLTDVSTAIYSTQGAERRGYTKAYITFDHNKICLLNTHLEIMPNADESRAVRTAQAAELLEVMKAERYAICAGDFNVSDCYNKSGVDYIAVIKPFIDEGYHSANSSDQHGFLATCYNGTTVNNYTLYTCIDEIITTSNIDINMVTVDKQKSDANVNALALDHLPIVAYCRVNG